MAQISEFSIVFVAMGITLGHVGSAALRLTTLAGLVTITASTYMILYSQPLYERLGRWLTLFERKVPHRELAAEAPGAHQGEQPEVIIFGLGRYGGRLAHGWRQSGLKVMGVDFDPEVARRHGRHSLPTRYGDGADADFLESLPLAQARWVISTLPEVSANATLLDGLKSHQFKGNSIVVAREQADESKLKALGVGTVLNPMRDAVDNAIESLTGLVQGKA